MNKEQNVTFINKFANYIGLLIISICVTLGVFAITNTKNNDSLSNQFSSELFNINSSKVQQSFTDLGNINRNIPKDTKNEGICLRYPTYGTSLENITEEEKDNLIKESSLIFPGTNTYTSLDKDGNYSFGIGNLTGKKIYKTYCKYRHDMKEMSAMRKSCNKKNRYQCHNLEKLYYRIICCTW